MARPRGAAKGVRACMFDRAMLARGPLRRFSRPPSREEYSATSHSTKPIGNTELSRRTSCRRAVVARAQRVKSSVKLAMKSGGVTFMSTLRRMEPEAELNAGYDDMLKSMTKLERSTTADQIKGP